MAVIAIRRASGKRSLIAADTYDPTIHTLWDAPESAEDAPESTITTAPLVAPVPVEKKRGRVAKRVKGRGRG